jgi:predicted metal-dependent phosphoesterase TrpH
MNPMRRLDLHCHTNRSDGRYTPAEVLAFAARSGLDTLAVTDHDLPGAVAPGVHEVEGHAIRIVGAAELSATHRGTEQHLLVYFRDEIPEGFRDFCSQLLRDRAERYDAAVHRLGGALPPADAAAYAGERSLTRHHLARALVADGRATDLHDAFARFCGDHASVVPPIKLTFVEAIRVARDFGGVPVWAHPGLAVVDSWLGELATAGLSGIEAIRPNHTSRIRQRYRKAARRHQLAITGGSDWHGWPADGALGTFHVTPDDVSAFLALLAA